VGTENQCGINFLMRMAVVVVLLVMLAGCGEDTEDRDDSVNPCLIVVSPHQDDETIMANGTLCRAAHDGRTRIGG
jgi:hypothetical protein